jgi:riboflavin kinase
MVDEILLFLLRSGAHRSAARLTTTEIAASLGMSQQNVSRRLRVLERAGSIRRGASGIALTDEGVAQMRELLATLQNAFCARLEMRGVVSDGLGEGRFYLSKPGYARQMREKLGFAPYPGTLNLRLEGGEAEKRRRMLQMEPIVIAGFSEGNRRYGDLFAYMARADGAECAVVVPLRTHHGQDVVELVAAVNLRKRLRKKTGDEVALRIG